MAPGGAEPRPGLPEQAAGGGSGCGSGSGSGGAWPAASPPGGSTEGLFQCGAAASSAASSSRAHLHSWAGTVPGASAGAGATEGAAGEVLSPLTPQRPDLDTSVTLVLGTGPGPELASRATAAGAAAGPGAGRVHLLAGTGPANAGRAIASGVVVNVGAGGAALLPPPAGAAAPAGSGPGSRGRTGTGTGTASSSPAATMCGTSTCAARPELDSSGDSGGCDSGTGTGSAMAAVNQVTLLPTVLGRGGFGECGQGRRGVRDGLLGGAPRIGRRGDMCMSKSRLLLVCSSCQVCCQPAPQAVEVPPLRPTRGRPCTSPSQAVCTRGSTAASGWRSRSYTCHWHSRRRSHRGLERLLRGRLQTRAHGVRAAGMTATARS